MGSKVIEGHWRSISIQGCHSSWSKFPEILDNFLEKYISYSFVQNVVKKNPENLHFQHNFLKLGNFWKSGISGIHPNRSFPVSCVTCYSTEHTGIAYPL